MKAKDLIKILELNPESQVLICEYTGGDTPCFSVNANNIQTFNTDELLQTDGFGDFISPHKTQNWTDKNNSVADTNLIILNYGTN